MKFSIITTVYNAKDWLRKNIESVQNQKYENFEHIIIDDCSTDGTLDVMSYSIFPKVIPFTRFKKVGILSNHILGLRLATGDIIVHLDGDDWFCTDNALDYIKEAYDMGALATYGNYQTLDGSPSVCKSFEQIKSIKDQIMKGWCFSHPRTFKRELASLIPALDLFDETGLLLPAAIDTTMFSSIYQHALNQGKLAFINIPLITYNTSNSNAEYKVDPRLQEHCAFSVARNPYGIQPK